MEVPFGSSYFKYSAHEPFSDLAQGVEQPLEWKAIALPSYAWQILARCSIHRGFGVWVAT
ncbi:hypothetical protein ACQ4M4_13875 [Leptolyngbya sp. AN02str]|uniref:hypothetical protein n=1 Tax=Leptolyngbya sp. AN02str TaxID=3423363 RepID=UPI003D317AB1